MASLAAGTDPDARQGIALRYVEFLRWGVDSVEVSTLVYVPPQKVYDFLVDFPRYAKYSRHLKEVTVHGDGSEGTQYDLTFAWWTLSYTAKSKVTDLENPHRIDWKLIRHLTAHGCWEIEAEPEAAPESREHATRVRFLVDFAPDSADSSAITLPPFVSMDWVISIAKPKIKNEAERVVKRIVADLEGEERDVSLHIHSTPESV